MEYDSLRQRPTGRVPHMLLAVIALLCSCLNIVVNGYSFASDTIRKPLGLGFQEVWLSDNASQVPAEKWIRYGALGVIYPWQLLWITFCVLQLACKASSVNVTWKALLTYLFASLLDVALVYATAWGQNTQFYHSALPLAFSVLLVLTLYSLVAMEAYHLYTLAPDINPWSRWAGWIVVLNGMVGYATWISIDAMLDMDDVIIKVADREGRTEIKAAGISGTIVLAMIGFLTVVYFLAEATVLDRFLRGVFVVYPIIIWTVSGINTMQNQRQVTGANEDLSLVLLVGACGLFLIRMILQVLFSMFRTLPKYKPNYVLR